MSERRPQTTAEAVAEFTKACNEFWRLICIEINRTAKKIDEAWRKP